MIYPTKFYKADGVLRAVDAARRVVTDLQVEIAESCLPTISRAVEQAKPKPGSPEFAALVERYAAAKATLESVLAERRVICCW